MLDYNDHPLDSNSFGDATDGRAEIWFVTQDTLLLSNDRSSGTGELVCKDGQTGGGGGNPGFPYLQFLADGSYPKTLYPTFSTGASISLEYKICGGGYHNLTGFDCRSTDVDADGDTDEQDEALLLAGYGTVSADLAKYDLNWSGAVDSADLGILMLEARRRNGSGQPFKRGHCDGGFDVESPMGYHGVYTYTAPGAVGSMSASLTAANTAQVSWIASCDDGSSGTAYSYEARMSASAITEENFAAATLISGMPTPLASGTGQSVTVTLPSQVTYYFAIRATDNAGWTSSNSTCSFDNSDVTAPATISSMTAINSSGQIRLRWYAPGDDGSTGSAAAYDIRRSDSPITSANFGDGASVAAPTPLSSGTLHTLYVDAVSCQQSYFAMKSRDECWNWSAMSNVPSAPALCEQPQTVPPGTPGGDVTPRALRFGQGRQTPGGIALSVDVPKPEAGAVLELAIFDAMGRKIRMLLTGAAVAGHSSILWDLRTDAGSMASSGMYYARLRVGDKTLSTALPISR